MKIIENRLESLMIEEHIPSITDKLDYLECKLASCINFLLYA